MRTFRAVAKPGAEEAFARLLTTESVRLVSEREGFLGWMAAGPADRQYLFVTFWRDEESVRAFAGERWQESVLPTGYPELLVSHGVEHARVLGSSGFAL